MNQRIGWALAVAGFAMGAWLDPWSLALVDSARMAVRQGQADVIAMAFFQLTAGDLVAAAPRASWRRTGAAVGTGAGAILYASGYTANSAFTTPRWPTATPTTGT
jgi:hypothetical protein